MDAAMREQLAKENGETEQPPRGRPLNLGRSK